MVSPKSTTLAVIFVEIENDGEFEVAVTVIVALPLATPFTLRVAVFVEPTVSVTLEGLIDGRTQLQPACVTPSATVPEKLPTLVTVMVEFLDEPAGIVTLEGEAEILKPTIVIEMVIGRAFRVPLVARIVAVYEPIVVELVVMFSLEKPIPSAVKVTIAGVKLAEGGVPAAPDTGEMVGVSDTLPENRLAPVIVTLEAAD